jgi:hypothetical protein
MKESTNKKRFLALKQQFIINITNSDVVDVDISLNFSK